MRIQKGHVIISRSHSLWQSQDLQTSLSRKPTTRPPQQTAGCLGGSSVSDRGWMGFSEPVLPLPQALWWNHWRRGIFSETGVNVHCCPLQVHTTEKVSSMPVTY